MHLISDLNLVPYLDDMIVPSTSNVSTHLRLLESAFLWLHKTNVKLKLKVLFARNSVDYQAYLGFVVKENQINPNSSKINIIQDFPVPRTPNDLKRFLGMSRFYSRFISNFATKVEPSRNLKICPKSCFIWTEDCQRRSPL